MISVLEYGGVDGYIHNLNFFLNRQFLALNGKINEKIVGNKVVVHKAVQSQNCYSPGTGAAPEIGMSRN